MLMINIFPWPHLPRRGLNWREYYQFLGPIWNHKSTHESRNSALFLPLFFVLKFKLSPLQAGAPEVKLQYTHRSSGTCRQIFTTQHASFPCPFLFFQVAGQNDRFVTAFQPADVAHHHFSMFLCVKVFLLNRPQCRRCHPFIKVKAGTHMSDNPLFCAGLPTFQIIKRTHL